jgi:hypothetical protein
VNWRSDKPVAGERTRRGRPATAGGLALVALCSVATAADWVWVDTPDVNQHYYDRSKLFVDGDLVTYWRRVVFRKPQPAKAGTARSAMYRERIDCRAHTHKTLGYLLYGSDGAVIENAYTPDTASEPVIPETVGDHYEKLMCALAATSRSGPAAPDPAAPRAEPSLTSQEALRSEIERLETRLRELKAQLPPSDVAPAASDAGARPPSQ